MDQLCQNIKLIQNYIKTFDSVSLYGGMNLSERNRQLKF